MKPYRDRKSEMECDGRAPGSRAFVACLMVASTMLYGVAVDARSGDMIWEGDDQSVVLAPQDDAGAPPNEHPVDLQPQDIETMLSNLRFSHADQERDTPPVAVFNKEQVQVLSDAFSRGLSRATPSQDVTFSVVGAHRLAPGALAMRNRLTAGRAFFREGKLNVIFGNIQSPYRKKNIYGRLEQDFYRRNFGSRTTPGAPESLLVAGTGASLHPEGDRQREDWVVFDVSAAAATDSIVPLPSPPTAAPDGSPEQRQVPAPAAHPAPAVRPTVRPATGSPSDEASHEPSGKTPDIEQRLERLKRLRDKDLISEEIYREKVDEILDEL